jgi:UBX domain-containing protein 6
MDQAASKIKKFFAKKKSDAKFKTAGRGVRLDSAASSSSQSQKPKGDYYVPVKRDDLTEEAKQARDAALKRILNNNRDKPLNISARAIKEQARKEIEEQARRKVAESESNLRNNVQIDEKKDYTIDGVYFTCPMISEEVLSKNEWKVKIKNFLYEQFEADPGLTSCLIIKNCNTFDKAEECIETLKKYIANIITNPDEPKYQKIRMSNRVFCDKVANVEGSLKFLTAAGFVEGKIYEIILKCSIIN